MKTRAAASWVGREDMQVRLAYSKAVGRVDYSDLIPQEVIDNGAGTITEFNPDLQSRKSDNFDLSFEYYFDEGDSLFSAAVFYKDIENEIVQSSFIRDDFVVTRSENAFGASVRGLEIGYVQNNLDFLPFNGLGVSLNYTYIDGEFETATRTFDRGINQPDAIFNASILYNYRNFEGRIAVNHASDYLGRFASDPDGDRFFESVTQTDLQLRYRLSDKWVLQFEGRNLGNENRVETRGTNRLVWEDNNFGRSFFIGVTYTN